MNPPAPSNPGVRFPPPFLFIGGLGIAWLLETRVMRIRLVGGNASAEPLQIAGAVLLVLGLLCIVSGMVTFARAHTAILPMRAASRIVETGPYRYTRNPMYVGMTVAYLGGALILNWGWAILVLPLVLIALVILVIRREETYLASAFGEDYEAYRRRVRRWI